MPFTFFAGKFSSIKSRYIQKLIKNVNRTEWSPTWSEIIYTGTCEWLTKSDDREVGIQLFVYHELMITDRSGWQEALLPIIITVMKFEKKSKMLNVLVNKKNSRVCF